MMGALLLGQSLLLDRLSSGSPHSLTPLVPSPILLHVQTFSMFLCKYWLPSPDQWLFVGLSRRTRAFWGPEAPCFVFSRLLKAVAAGCGDEELSLCAGVQRGDQGASVRDPDG